MREKGADSCMPQVWAWHLQVVEVIEERLYCSHPRGAVRWVRDMAVRIFREHGSRDDLDRARLRRQAWPCGMLRSIG